MNSVSAAAGPSIPAIPPHQQEPTGLTSAEITRQIHHIRNDESKPIEKVANRIGLIVAIPLALIAAGALVTLIVLGWGGIAAGIATITLSPLLVSFFGGLGSHHLTSRFFAVRWTRQKNAEIAEWRSGLERVNGLGQASIKRMVEIFQDTTIQRLFYSMNGRQQFYLIKAMGVEQFLESTPNITFTCSASEQMIAALRQVPDLNSDQLAQWLRRRDIRQQLDRDRGHLLSILALAQPAAVQSEIVYTEIDRLAERYYPLRNHESLLREVMGTAPTTASTDPLSIPLNWYDGDDAVIFHVEGEVLHVNPLAIASSVFLSGVTEDTEGEVHLPTDTYEANTWKMLLAILHNATNNELLRSYPAENLRAVAELANYCGVGQSQAEEDSVEEDSVEDERIDHSFAQLEIILGTKLYVSNFDELIEALEFSNRCGLNNLATNLIDSFARQYLPPQQIDALATRHRNAHIQQAIQTVCQHYVERALRPSRPYSYLNDISHFKDVWEEISVSETLKQAIATAITPNPDTDNVERYHRLIRRIWPTVGQMPFELEQVVNPPFEEE